MEITLTSDQVISQIQKLHHEGANLRKKAVKQKYPELMRSALHYYPSWQEALAKSEVDI